MENGGGVSEHFQSEDLFNPVLSGERLHGAECYIDDGYTGTNFNRPGFQRLLRDIERGKIKTVITKDLSRLGRDYIETGRYVECYFPEKGIRYIAVNDGVDDRQEESAGNDYERV